jgi:hypothetical protein
MTSSNTMAKLKEADERKRIRRMALATTTTYIDIMIGVFIVAYVILYFMGLMAYVALHGQPKPQEGIDAMVAVWHLSKPMIPAMVAMILFTGYRHGIRKARKLKKMKEHEFLISCTSEDTYNISGTMTIAGADVKYSMRLYDGELEPFEQL